MSNQAFLFKQFAIEQGQTAMKVGTDGVLLGAWATANKHDRILDIGTGTGLIALMLAQRFPEALIDAVEIDDLAAEQAATNFLKSPWAERIAIHHQRIQEYASDNFYNLIVSNPPFFENSKKSGDQARDLARHTDQLTYTELILAANNLLKEGGSFAIILPYDQSENFIRLAEVQGFSCNRVCNVKPTPDKSPKRLLAEFNKFKTDKIEEELIIEEHGRHQYSNDYIQLTREFYLNL